MSSSEINRGTRNQLHFGDNLNVLRNDIANESVDLIYLDPPFNSNANYSVLFREPEGTLSQAQIEAFEDTWKWGMEAEIAFDDVLNGSNQRLGNLINALRDTLGDSSTMAYVAMMAVRLVELHRVLKPHGCLYLHCDPTASHYLKILLDGVFGPAHFINEIVWKRAFTVKGNHGQGAKFFGRNTDSIFFYSKSKDYYFKPVFKEYSEDYLTNFYKYVDDDGRRYRLISMIGPGGAAKGNPHYEVMGVSRYWRYSRTKMAELIEAGLVVQTKPGTVPQRKQFLEDGSGVAVQALWDDIPALGPGSKESLGYQTQKPVALLERIIEASCPLDGVVLDPFCGCGTAVHAAQRLGRTWIGIDVTHVAIALIESRIVSAFPDIQYDLIGTPKDLAGAKALAARNKHQFEWWAVSLVKAQPANNRKKGADNGIDGVMWLRIGARDRAKVVVSVKGGYNVSVAMIRDLVGVLEREKAAIGLFVTLNEPTGPMKVEAAKAGFFIADDERYARIQILTIEELFEGRKPDLPLIDHAALRPIAQIDRVRTVQHNLL